MDDEIIRLPLELAQLSSLVEEKPEAFAAGSQDIQHAALQATKYVFDLALQTEAISRAHIAELLTSISPDFAPQTRSKSAANGKRKHSPSPVSLTQSLTLKETPLVELFIDGMSEDQLWAQLELRAKNVCDILDLALDGGGGVDREGEESDAEAKKMRQAMLGEDGDMDFEDNDGLEDDDSEEDGSDSALEEGDNDEMEDDEDGEEDAAEETITDLRDSSDDDRVDLDQPGEGKRVSRRKTKVASHPELDDGFFDLAAFNAETEEAEARSTSRGKLGGGDDDDSSEEEDTDFVDLFVPVTGDAIRGGGDADGESEPLYRDFFDPPPRVPSSSSTPRKVPSMKGTIPKTIKVRFHDEVRVKSIRAQGKGLPLSAPDEDEEDEDEDEDDEEGDEDEGEDGDDLMDEDEFGEIMSNEGDEDDEMSQDSEADFTGKGEFGGRETIERLKDDLFGEEDEENETGLSAYQQRQASLREEIQTLEAQNVAKKDWTLMGEATSRSRPQNSLLEEDLEFERVMKAVPVITEEVVQGLEERIKARILENQFDDVVRRRAVDDKPFLPSRFFELQDTKSKQSLAEIYEDEFTAAQTGGVAGEDRDGKLKKEHDEITQLWDNICHKLDALCNAHFTPKTPKASISTVSNVAATTLESALPTTKSTSTMLAPEEVFAPSPADLRAKSELTPAEKRALHNKQKKAKRKARDTLDKSVDKYARMRGVGGIKKQKEAALKSIVKNGKGVTVVGKNMRDITGRPAKRHNAS